MAGLLRQIELPNWIKPEWLPAGHFPANAFRDLQTSNRDSQLSVYRVDDAVLIPRIAVALSIQRVSNVVPGLKPRSLRAFGYVCIPAERIAQEGIICDDEPSNTVDAMVNRLHTNLHHLTAATLMRLLE